MKKGNNNKKKLVISIGICIMLIALMMPASLGGGPSGPWNFWSNKPHIFNTNTGNVGIGTSTPEEKLHIIDGNIRVDNGSIHLVHLNGYKTYIDSDSLNTRITDLASGHIIFSTGTSPGTASSRFCIANNGNIGIGTLSPEERLHILYGNIRVDGTTSGPAIHGVAYAPYSAIYGENNFGGIGIKGYSNGGWAGYFSGDVFTDGKMGIGTETPLGKLDVEADDDIAIIGGTNSGTTGVYGFAGANGAAVHGQNPSGGIAISGYSNGGLAGFFAGDVYINGDVGIGILPSLGKLYVNAYDDIAVIGATTSGTSGVYGVAGANGAAVHGQNPDGGVGVSGYSNGGYAGYFCGDTYINGDLEVTGTISGGTIVPRYNVKEITDEGSGDFIYDVEDTDYTLFVNTVDDGIIIHLPPASENEGRILIIKKIDNNPYTVHISAYSEDFIEYTYNNFISITSQGKTFTLQSNGDNMWYIIGEYL